MATLLNNSEQEAFTTLARMKVFLSLSTDQYDSVLTQLINFATGFIETYTKRNLLKQTYTQEKYDGTGSNKFTLKQFPVTALTTLEYNQATDNTDDWKAFDSEEFFIDLDTGIVTKTSGVFINAPQKYRATYDAGYLIDFSQENDPSAHTLPQEIEYVCQKLVAGVFNMRKGEGLDKMDQGDQGVVMQKTFFESKEIRGILNRHKNFNVASNIAS